MHKPSREHVVLDALSRLLALGMSNRDVFNNLIDVSATIMLQINNAFKLQLLVAYNYNKYLSQVKALVQVAKPGSTSFKQNAKELI